MDRPALAEFLRARRGALTPADVGLPAGARRRTAGLRREEVAQLAAMSTDYYTRLEQQRGPQPSPQMLAALARALRLDDDARDYLFRTAGQAAPDRISGPGHVSPALLRVLDRLDDTPALVISALGETLAQNRLAAALLGDRSADAGWDRYEPYRWFAHPGSARAHYPESDHARQSRAQVAALRQALGMLGARGRAAELVAELEKTSAEFRALWARQEVGRRFAEHKVLLHPEAGAIEVDCQVLATEDRAQALLILTPSGTEAAERLRLVGVLGTQAFAAGASGS
ncbi:helix-turn-helix transcriptional regulator [Microbacterium excoecariae]|uniref:helix-turn-helix transcriptional regulator n=1 Tax=Microbacterium excoecariae TaxID=2715210 RepID=UPI0014072787|nr:helix-turn-helix transcriptional regulator [Microbacterium excoecariae]NHI15639.1 helix-turn-helix domain-containing protein [Microbacterium excoecariae]